MQTPDWIEWLMLAATCLFTALAAVYWLAPQRLSLEPARDLSEFGPDLGHQAVWLFDGTDLIDQSEQARLLLDGATATDWHQLCTWLSRQFPGFPTEQTVIRNARSIVVPPAEEGDPARVTCEWLDGIVRVHLADIEAAEAVSAVGHGLLTTQRRELSALRNAVEKSPYPIWRLAGTGEVTWSNPAYDRLDRAARGATGDGPVQSVFPVFLDRAVPGETRRLPVDTGEGKRRHWFDVSVVPDPSGAMCYAIDVDAVVEAESAQRQFVQTLAKTFAQLSIGLAIFDRNRQLALFNPALIDLTTLPADFLSARPNLLSFFDRLRDQKMMPEPKNYNSWRHQMADLVAAASDGRYHETWSLPSGSVYSVSGRPHPDRAIAFLFEDITAEITLTRRFRSDLEMGQSILDRLDQAIAVFAADGSLTVTNAGYRTLWSVDPDNSFVPISVIDATRTWQDQCRPTPLWGEIRDFVATRENRVEWTGDVRLTTGELVACRITPLPKGATMVSFVPQQRSEPVRRNGKAQPLAAHL